jgi:filamentous hemagglutinin family protein
MKIPYLCLSFICGIFTNGILLPAKAQVISDGTTDTTVNSIGKNFNILNGIEKGNNLFHSFSNFSVPTGGSGTFNLTNRPNITTIFSRVTGGNVSNIDGLIRTLNSSNPVSLFLMNPNGIIFGQNAKLDIGGSFVGTTVNSIKFADGTEFSTVNPSGTPLLTMSVPVGLQMGSNSDTITVNGLGHGLFRQTTLSPIIRQDKSNGLRVQQGKTLALVGGKITLNGGILTAEGGNIELGSIAQGTINLNQTNQGFTLDYAGVSDFRDIELLKAALLDTSGTNAGSIQVQGRNVSLADGSIIWIQNQGLQASGNINVNASELFKIVGNTPNENISSRLHTETVRLGKGGDIAVSSKQLLLQEFGNIVANTYTSAPGGNLTINVSESVRSFGVSSIKKNSSSINTATYGSGNTGFVKLSTKQLTILDGAFIGSTTLSSGNAGDVTVNASESIEAIGISPLFIPSAIGSNSIGSGNAGKLTVNTGRLTVRDGGRIDSSTTVSGAAGSVTINASKSVEISGVAVGSRNPSLIISSANILDEALRKRFGLPEKPFGASGNVTINTPQLTVKDGALVSVRNEGSGNGGTLQVNANSINLDTKGGITAATESGEGGNIVINLQDSLVMRGGSRINAETKGTGNGGNISIDAPVIVGLENSDIIANAVKGNGGNIDIKTQGIFGLEYRNQLTPESDITASSQFGVNGTVDINNFGTDPSSGLVELPENVTDPSQQIASGCSANQGSSFVATGRGGIPQNPSQEVRSDRTWSDIRDISTYRKNSAVTAQIPTNPKTLIQATSWHRNAEGKIELIADKSSTQVQQQLTCAAIPES